MPKNYKYDVALSFANEDKKIAEKIAKALNELGLRHYFYENETAENWGENLFNIIINRYREESRFALILISENYVKKKWADIERQIIQTITERNRSCYILPLSLDSTVVEGITDNILHVKWEGKPKKIARLIKDKLEIMTENNEQLTQKRDENKGKISHETIIGNVGRDFNQTNQY